ncbi:membrane lipoprotein [Vibrio phage 1.134.O._10N.222.52.B8]|nr:membrane lipoprotein [Vibrio phage 1.134.O._10N.222.52.B8]
MKLAALTLMALLISGCSSANFNVNCVEPIKCNLNVPESAVVHITNDSIEIKYDGQATNETNSTNK